MATFRWTPETPLYLTDELIHVSTRNQLYENVIITGYEDCDLPTNFDEFRTTENLVIQDCPRLTRLPESVAGMRSLARIEISRAQSLKRLCPNLRQLQFLQMVILRRCDFVIFPEDLTDCFALRQLLIDNMDELESIPDAAFENLPALVQLIINYCPRLKSLPVTINLLDHLDKLLIANCGLTRLPAERPQFVELTELRLVRCAMLTAVPDWLDALPYCRLLDLSECRSLTALPPSIGQMHSLQTLNMDLCTDVQTLPDTIGDLRLCERLILSSCWKLQALPTSMLRVSSLRELDLSYCSALAVLPRFPATVEVHLEGTPFEPCQAPAAPPLPAASACSIQLHYIG
jgi:hypothetical protein